MTTTSPAGAVHEHRGTRAIQRMVEYAPATGSLALWIAHRDDDDLGKRELEAATDGEEIRYGPAFEGLTLARQTGLVAHQVLHVALRHPQRSEALRQVVGDVDPELFNACADAIVNSALGHLSWLELSPRAVRLEALLSRVLRIDEPVEKSLLEWDVERLYRAIDDRQGRSASGGGGGGRQEASAGEGEGQQGSGGQGGDPQQQEEDSAERAASSAQRASDLDQMTDGPRASATRDLAAGEPRDLLPAAAGDAPEAEAERARDWRERISRGHARDGAHSLLRELLADVPMPRTPWQALLRTWLARGLAPLTSISWSRPARSWLANQGRDSRGRRMPFEPGTSSLRAVTRLVVMVDVSGSIDEPLLRRFCGEITAIGRRCEAHVSLIVGDDQVRHVKHFRPGMPFSVPTLDIEGGGGTDFTPLLEAADELRPDIGVVLTDLEGPARLRPRWPVIWATPASAAEVETPFGRRLHLD